MPARALPPRDPDALADLAAVVLEMNNRELQHFAAALPADDLLLLEHVLAEKNAIGWRSDPLSMALHLDPRRVRRWRYLAHLSTEFVAGVTGERPRQIWNLASRYGKTTLLRWGVAWGLDRAPASRWIWTTYGDDLALESASAIRDMLRQHAATLHVQLRLDRQRGDRFLTPEGGGVLGAGMNSAIVGFGCGDGGGMIIDDPMKNWQEAHSQAKRDATWNGFIGTLRHRLDQEEAPIFVVHARWHQDDLSGRLKEGAEDETGEAWHVVSLPTIAKPGDVLGRQPGEVLEPERFPPDAVARRHHALGTYLVAALEQQDPSPPEGKELLREWFVLAQAGELPHAPDMAITSWDLKLKDREAGDYVVGQCWWRVAGAYWCMDVLRGQFDHATTACAIALLAVRNPQVVQHYIETAGSYDSVVPELRKPQRNYRVTEAMAARLGMSPEERAGVETLRRRGMQRLVGHPPVGDKSVRARTYIAPNAEAGLVRMPAEARWVPALLDEVAGFPEGHDDQVDAMSQALQRLSVGEATAQAATGSIQPRQPGPVAKPRGAVSAPGGNARVARPKGVLRPVRRRPGT